jgi:hypothetical protein
VALDRDQLRELEVRLARIANVEAASIRTGSSGEIEAVDIVADRQRSPQRIVRDAEILFRQDGIDIDHRKIGVAALDSPAALFDSRPQPAMSAWIPDSSPPQPIISAVPRADLAVLSLEPDEERIRLAAVHSTTRNGAFTVEVELALGAYEGVPGRATGPGQEPVGCATLVARATLDSVRNLLQPGYEAQLRELKIVDLTGSPAVVACVDFGEGRRLQRLVGACLQFGSLYDTAVYATLDAINRPLGRARFRELAAFDTDDRARA